MVFIVISAVIAAIIIIALLISFYENRHIKVKEYNIESKHIGKSVRLVFISDLHSCTYGENNTDLISAIDKANPDLVLIGGDVYNGIENFNHEAAEEFIRGVSKNHKVYYALGNHEYRFFLYPDKFKDCWTNFLKLLKECNVHLLDNSCSLVTVNENKIKLYGLSIKKEYYKRFGAEAFAADYIDRTLGKNDSNVFSILMAHNPKYYKEYSLWKPELILSGHYHGGIMRFKNQGVISPTLRLFPKYSYGLITESGSKMIVSGGLGVHTLPFRIFNPPELVVVNLKDLC